MRTLKMLQNQDHEASVERPIVCRLYDDEFRDIVAGMLYYNTPDFVRHEKRVARTLVRHYGRRHLAISTPNRRIAAQTCLRPRAMLYVLDVKTGQRWLLIKFLYGQLVIFAVSVQPNPTIRYEAFDISETHASARRRNVHTCLF